ncbi:hypothetical protein LX32DRAFT_80080 [Colletotrichum zoysiae]|uniref:Uncharacterized protein n=1 Tax=Colletotrichum zoysiae TaxID=1216348 RepID=A0AAD9LXK0_9PEZI|nr:hypothetical protein LX32DRAFT_80080 [Colletotrichum zoysiae]
MRSYTPPAASITEPGDGRDQQTGALQCRAAWADGYLQLTASKRCPTVGHVKLHKRASITCNVTQPRPTPFSQPSNSHRVFLFSRLTFSTPEYESHRLLHEAACLSRTGRSASSLFRLSLRSSPSGLRRPELVSGTDTTTPTSWRIVASGGCLKNGFG